MVKKNTTQDWLIILLVFSVFKVFGEISVFIELFSIILLILVKYDNKKILINKNNYYYLWEMLFLGFSIFSIIWCESSKAVLYGCRGVIECILIGISVNSYINSRESVVKLFKIIILSGAALIIKIVLTISTSNILLRELGSLNANTVGVEFAFIILIIIWLRKEKRITLNKLILMASVFIVGVLFAGSKKAIIALVIGLVVMRILYSKNILVTLKRIIGISVVLVIVYFLIMNVESLYQLVGKRFEGMMNAFVLGKEYGDASTYERMLLANSASEMWKNRPIIGYGLNSFEYLSSLHLYTHNNYLELLVGVGVIGTAIYYSIFVWIIGKCIKYIKADSIFVLFISVCMIILACDFGYVSYGDPFFQMIIATMCTVISLMKQHLYKLSR